MTGYRGSHRPGQPADPAPGLGRPAPTRIPVRRPWRAPKLGGYQPVIPADFVRTAPPTGPGPVTVR